MNGHVLLREPSRARGASKSHGKHGQRNSVHLSTTLHGHSLPLWQAAGAVDALRSHL